MKLHLYFCFIVVAVLLYSLPVESKENLLRMEKRLNEEFLSASEKIALYDSLHSGYYSYDAKKSIMFANEGIKLVRQEGDMAMQVRFLISLGNSMRNMERYDISLYFLTLAESIAKKENISELLCYIYDGKADTYHLMKRYIEAIEHYYTALAIAENRDDAKTKGSIYSDIGTMLATQGQWTRAISYYKKSLAISERQQDTLAMARAHFNLGSTYRRLEEKDNARHHIMTAWNMSSNYNNSELHASGLMSLANYYKDNGDPGLSLKTNLRALEIAKNTCYSRLIDDIRKEIILNHLELGSDNNVLMMAKEMLLQVDTTRYKLLFELHHAATVANIRTGDKLAAQRHLQSMLDNIALSNDKESWNALTEMEAKYEMEKKELQIATLAERNEHFIVIIIISFAGILALLLALVVYNRYQKLKRLRMQEEIEHIKQESLLNITRSLLQGEDRERIRVARELHDGLGGLLTMIKMNLAQIRNNTPINYEKLDKSIALTDRTIDEMRRIAHNIMPAVLERFGLAAAIEEFCEGSEKITFYFYGENRRFERSIEINIFRIAGELINNALKHSKATVINVQLIVTPDMLTLTTEDNGLGIPDDLLDNALSTTRSRVEILGASIDIYSKAGKGTEITVRLGLKQYPNENKPKEDKI